MKVFRHVAEMKWHFRRKSIDDTFLFVRRHAELLTDELKHYAPIRPHRKIPSLHYHTYSSHNQSMTKTLLDRYRDRRLYLFDIPFATITPYFLYTNISFMLINSDIHIQTRCPGGHSPKFLNSLMTHAQEGKILRYSSLNQFSLINPHIIKSVSVVAIDGSWNDGTIQ